MEIASGSDPDSRVFRILRWARAISKFTNSLIQFKKGHVQGHKAGLSIMLHLNYQTKNGIVYRIKK